MAYVADLDVNLCIMNEGWEGVGHGLHALLLAGILMTEALFDTGAMGMALGT